ncbi:hypothetical protein, partial [Actinobacillus pleuropneumoniae]|uniref:hypothetical protein n=1 Tax=Actinobacillus pleuropneumoniae TaxID=715 RepID=UPI00227B7E15
FELRLVVEFFSLLPRFFPKVGFIPSSDFLEVVLSDQIPVDTSKIPYCRAFLLILASQLFF